MRLVIRYVSLSLPPFLSVTLWWPAPCDFNLLNWYRTWRNTMKPNGWLDTHTLNSFCLSHRLSVCLVSVCICIWESARACCFTSCFDVVGGRNFGQTHPIIVCFIPYTNSVMVSISKYTHRCCCCWCYVFVGGGSCRCCCHWCCGVRCYLLRISLDINRMRCSVTNT